MVSVHLNLNRGDWVLAEKPRAPVAGYFSSIALRAATFKISEKRRQAIINSAKKHREVHAWAVGDRVEISAVPAGGRVEITYNPHRCGYFHRRDSGEAVHAADYLIFDAQRRVFAINPR